MDVISLGIGDPDMPTPPNVVEAMERAVRDPSTHTYPSNRGRPEFREAVASFYRTRFGVELDPETQVMPAIGGKECIFNLNFAFLDEGDVALAADPGYPLYTGGPLIAGARAGADAARARAGLRAGPVARSRTSALERARLMFVNYPNNPTGAVVPDGFFERVGRVRARARPAGRARLRLLGADLRRLRGAELPRDARARWTSAWRCSRSPRAGT